jgi:hypothetical protein
MADNLLAPYLYHGVESWHPPLYYFFAGIIMNIERLIVSMESFTLIRAFSVVLYMAFCFYGVLTLRAVTSQRGLPYYTGVFLIVFWPTAMLLASRISNDIALYPIWAASYYYLTRWYTGGRITHLRACLMVLGLVFLIKSNAVIPLGITVASILYALLCRRINRQQLLSLSNIPALVVLLAGIALNFGKLIYFKLNKTLDLSYLHFGGSSTDLPYIWHFLSFDLSDFIIRPFNDMEHEITFFNNFLKTMIFGEYTWRYPLFASGISILLLVFLTVSFSVTILSIRYKKLRVDDIAPHMLAIAIPIYTLMMFYLIKRWGVCQDFRFVVPMLIPIVILFVRGMESIASLPHLQTLYRIGLISGIAMPFAACIFFILQYL